MGSLQRRAGLFCAVWTVYVGRLSVVGSGGQGCGYDVYACGQFLVEGVKSHTVVAYQAQTVDEALCVLFLFDLLGDKPIEFAACGVVVLGFGQCVQVVDERGDFLLML